MNRRLGMPRGQFRQVHRRGFAGQVAGDLDPGVLKNDRLELRRACDDRIEFRRVAVLGDPEFHADHRAVADAAVEFVEAGLRVLRVEIDEAERAVGKRARWRAAPRRSPAASSPATDRSSIPSP